MARNAVLIVSFGALIAALGGLAGQATAGQAVRQADMIIYPGMLHLGHARSVPPTTAVCESHLHAACYEPNQIRHAYNLPVLFRHGVNGKGSTIVIVDPFGSPTIGRDLSVFDRQFHFRAPPAFVVIQPAGPVRPYNPANPAMVSWAGETTLDVEYAHTIAPDAKILLVETPVAETEGVTGFPQIVKAEEYVINHHLGGVISQSFEVAEETFPSKAALRALRGAYTDAYRHHVTVLSAAGDSGVTALGLDQTTYFTHPVTTWPASDPLVTGVGGTQLHLNASGGHTSADTVWNDTYNKAVNAFEFGDAGPNPIAGGGGKSAVFARPRYQDHLRDIVGGSRGVPDIAMGAACNGAVVTYDSFGGQPAGWYLACGTSVATPLFAGIVALASQVAGHPLGLINPALYKMSALHLPGIVDVVTGNNTVSFTQDGRLHTVRGFSAHSGYSLAAGVGTVNAALFVPELAAFARH